MNRGEGRRHLFAAQLLASLGRRVLVPVPVLVEVDLLLRARGHVRAATVFARACVDGVHQLADLTDEDLRWAINLGERYHDSGIDLPDLAVMALARRHQAPVLTWDFRHFRAVTPARDQPWDLMVAEHELPAPS